MANKQTSPFVTASVAGLLSNPQADLQRELQERQKNLLAAGKTPASTSNMLSTPFGTATQGLIGG